MTFEKILLEAIDQSLACLGEQTKKAVYLHLENKYSLRKQDIPYKIKDFTEALEETFQTGAKLLEIEIMMILFSKVGSGYVPLEKPDSLEFTSYVYALRNRGVSFLSPPVLCQPQRNCKFYTHI